MDLKLLLGREVVNHIGFDELVTMLNGEDQQMSKDLPSDHTIVLVATRENSTSQGNTNSAIEKVLSKSVTIGNYVTTHCHT